MELHGNCMKLHGNCMEFHGNCMELHGNCVELHGIARCNARNCEPIKLEITGLRESLRNYELDDETIQTSKNNQHTPQLVEPYVKVVHDRYEILVLLKTEVVGRFPNNVIGALERGKSLRSEPLKYPNLKLTLAVAF